MSWLGILKAALLSTAIALSASQVAHAQDASADREAIFAQLLEDPSNVVLALRYARLSNAAGDTEAAIGALERILFYEPNEPNTRLFLGMLYGKLGSYDMARGYFQSVLNYPATPEDIRARATALMVRAEQKTEPSQFSAYVRTGLRWQSNASNEPDGDYIAYNWGFESWETVEGAPESDWNAYVQGGIFYSYDFGNQRGDAFEASLTTYNSRQFDLDEFNFNMVEAIVGVRFGIPTDNPTSLASIKPYLIASGALLEDDPYFWSGGGGVQVTAPIGAWTISSYVQAIWREYDNDDPEDIFNPNDFSGKTGAVYSAGLRASSNPQSALRWNGHLGYERRKVDDPDEFSLWGDFFDEDGNYSGYDLWGPFSDDYDSYNRLFVDMRMPFDLYLKGHHLLVTPLIGVRYTKYDEPDPFAQFPVGAVDREDWQYRAGVAFDYAINDWAGVGAQFLYTTTDSNLEAYETDNLSISFGPHFRF